MRVPKYLLDVTLSRFLRGVENFLIKNENGGVKNVIDELVFKSS